ncbi:unnamed protein product [Peronospora farinosa]|uniref:Ribosomal RNA processing protein 1 n=1 Tax=Peronospora farinosa TaxID=134698 RepID=A0ABN8BS95_9STRA|nr:unnamed protein product [Peronospora farinosa]
MENAASRFGQHLAHTVYLTKKKEWTNLEWDKLWKALFYCMWMSDKRPVQEELSSNLAALVHHIPSTESALAFVRSFFRTMQREWHGLDGLRLDKFYSLVRKFVREAVALLRVQDWNETLVQELADILSTEVVSQLPNGPRMHLADLYLTEIYNAAGKDIVSEAFVTLLEPFFTLLNSEYDKTVFKRVRELVFDEILSKYKFGPQTKTGEEEEKEETDMEEDEEEEHKVFEKVELALVQHRIFAIASADATIERNRSALYTLYKKFFAITRVDSFQAAQKEADKPKKKTVKIEKKHKEENSAAIETIKKFAKNEKACAKNVQLKKRRIQTEAKVDAEAEIKKIEFVKEEKEEAASPKKKATKQKIAMETKVEKIEMMKLPAEIKKGKKKQKMVKLEVKEMETKLVEKESSTSVKDKKSAKEQTKLKKENFETKKEPDVTVTTSGKKFKRCGSCGGYGKNLVPNDKNLCGHCEHIRKAGKKKAASASKKRKAESQAQATREEKENAESNKKVTFGKSKALPHTVSIKRLKASAKRIAVSRNMDNFKGVLKMTTQLPVPLKKLKTKKMSKGRKAAVELF